MNSVSEVGQAECSKELHIRRNPDNPPPKKKANLVKKIQAKTLQKLALVSQEAMSYVQPHKKATSKPDYSPSASSPTKTSPTKSIDTSPTEDERRNSEVSVADFAPRLSSASQEIEMFTSPTKIKTTKQPDRPDDPLVIPSSPILPEPMEESPLRPKRPPSAGASEEIPMDSTDPAQPPVRQPAPAQQTNLFGGPQQPINQAPFPQFNAAPQQQRRYRRVKQRRNSTGSFLNPFSDGRTGTGEQIRLSGSGTGQSFLTQPATPSTTSIGGGSPFQSGQGDQGSGGFGGAWGGQSMFGQTENRFTSGSMQPGAGGGNFSSTQSRPSAFGGNHSGPTFGGNHSGPTFGGNQPASSMQPAMTGNVALVSPIVSNENFGFNMGRPATPVRKRRVRRR